MAHDAFLFVNIAENSYLCHPQGFDASLKLQTPKRDQDERAPTLASNILPATVVKTDGRSDLQFEYLRAKLDNMLLDDDVLDSNFFQAIILTHHNIESVQLSNEFLVELRSIGCHSLYFSANLSPSIQGPVFKSELGLHFVYRMYRDPNEAFISGTIQSAVSSDGYISVPSSLIPVPSRLYYDRPTPEKPLNGVRLAIKDLIDVKGIQTTAGSRAYARLNRVAQQSAPAVQKLLDLGAIVIGKTRTSQFAAGAEPNYWIDYHCSWNPRGDEYESTSGSSVGSAVAVAAYEWVDIGLGTDTLGSVAWPASAQGIYGLRFSFGLLSQIGTVLLSKKLDTFGILGRNLPLMRRVSRTWLQIPEKDITLKAPIKLLWPNDVFKTLDPENLNVMERFISDMESTFSIKRIQFDMSQLWKEKCPIQPYVPLTEFLDQTLATIQLYGSWSNTIAFREEYKSVFGNHPYADPTVNYKWSHGATISKSDFDEALSRAKVFQEFLSNQVFNESSILFHPGGVYSFATSGLRYRDEYLGPPSEVAKRIQGYHYKNTFCSFIGGSPFLMAPVGQCIRWSRATQQNVYEPISIGLIGPKGSDISLIKMVEATLKASGRPQEILTGSTAFARDEKA